VVAFALWSLRSQNPAMIGSTGSPDVEIQRLTLSGDVGHPTIARDGRFVAFVRGDVLWLRHISTTTGQRDVQLVPKASGRTYLHPTITPDGDHVDFVAVHDTGRELWRVPLLGGAPQRIVSDVWSAVSWSPDGKSMAFWRYTPE